MAANYSAGGAPTYVSSERAPGQPQFRAPELAVPNLPNNAGVGMEKFGAGLVDAGVAVGKLGEHIAKARDETNAAMARTTYMTNLQALRKQFEQDPDPSTAGVRFAQETQRIEDEAASTIGDGVRRETARFHMRVQGLFARDQVERRSLANEANVNQGLAAKRRPVHLDNALNATTPIQRQAAEDEFDADVDQQANAGWIDPPTARAQKRGFRAEVATADTRALIRQNPSAAVIALDSQEGAANLEEDAPGFLPEPIRAKLSDEARAAETAADTAPANAMVAQGFDALANNTLDPDWIAAATPTIGDAAAKRFAGALAPAPTKFDASHYADLLDQAIDDQKGALTNAADAYREGRIDRLAFLNIYEMSKGMDQAVEGRPWELDVRRDLVGWLRPTEHQDPQAARSQLDALHTFDLWLDDNTDASYDDARAEAQRVAGTARAAAAAHERATLPLPQFNLAPREKFNSDDLVVAATRLRDANDAGTLSDDDLVEQADLVRRWQDVLQRSTVPGK